MADEAVSLLRRARARIEDPAHWTQGRYARSAKGHEVKPDSESATSWCAIGALRAEVLEKSAYWAAFGELVRYIKEPTSLFNDTHTHVEVLAVFDAAIESLRVREETR